MGQTELSLKSLSKTLWYARADATRALFFHYNEITQTLSAIVEDTTQNKMTRHEAEGLLEKIKQFDTALMTYITVFGMFSQRTNCYEDVLKHTSN